MLFRLSLSLAYLVYVVDLGLLVNGGQFSAADKNFFNAGWIEKSFFLACAIIFLTKSSIDKVVLICLAALILYIVVVAQFVEYPGFSWPVLINALPQIVMLFLFLSGTPSQRDRRFMLTVAAWAPIGSALLGLVYDVTHIQPMFVQEYVTGSMRYQASLIPSSLSSIAMSGAFASTLMILEKRKEFLWLLVLDFVVLMLAGGRITSLAALIACAGVYLASPNLEASKKVLALYTGLLGGALLLGVLVALLGDTLLSRFDAGANGRDLIWAYLNNLGNAYFWTGIGFGHQFIATPEEIVRRIGSTAAHNDYLRLFVELGFPGVILFYSILTYVVFHIWGHRFWRKTHNILISYVAFLLLMTVDNALVYIGHLFLLIFGSVPARVGEPDSQNLGEQIFREWRLRPSETQHSGRGSRCSRRF